MALTAQAGYADINGLASRRPRASRADLDGQSQIKLFGAPGTARRQSVAAARIEPSARSSEPFLRNVR